MIKELYLRKNSISDLREIRYLMKLPVLKVLWLHDNPCAQVISLIKSGVKLSVNRNPTPSKPEQTGQQPGQSLVKE
jgi:Leucine-rich repeat (LRR) protein